MNYLVFLQNAWSPLYAGSVWPRASWLRALQSSKSGQMIRPILPAGAYQKAYDIVENTTPIVGATASSKVPPDMKYIEEILDRRKPDLIVTCGQQAIDALERVWGGAVVQTPHPACRWLTREIFLKAEKLIEAYSVIYNTGFKEEEFRFKIWQAKGQPVDVIKIP